MKKTMKKTMKKNCGRRVAVAKALVDATDALNIIGLRVLSRTLRARRDAQTAAQIALNPVIRAWVLSSRGWRLIGREHGER